MRTRDDAGHPLEATAGMTTIHDAAGALIDAITPILAASSPLELAA